MTERDGAIGVFDSGVGGLSVLRALRAALPHEDFIYLGDTARLPYGTKSDATVVRYSVQCAAALFARGIRCLVVACNTASASALGELKAIHAPVPVIGVIEPGAAAAVAASVSQSIAVIATEGTVRGGAYPAAIHRLDPDARVVSAACPLFVAIAEEGWLDGEIATAVAHRYLDPLFEVDSPPDTLVLGCTHFPALLPVIRAVVPAAVRIVDSAAVTAAAVQQTVPPVSTRHEHRPQTRWLATDGAARFARVGARFLGEPIQPDQVILVDL